MVEQWESILSAKGKLHFEYQSTLELLFSIK